MRSDCLVGTASPSAVGKEFWNQRWLYKRTDTFNVTELCDLKIIKGQNQKSLPKW